MDRQRRRSRYEGLLKELGAVTYDRIEVAPFAVERFGTTFGLLGVAAHVAGSAPTFVDLL